MIVSERVGYERILLNTPGTSSNRWPEAQLIAHLDRAQKAIVSRIRFPDSRLSLTTTSQAQEYPLPDTHRIHRVYINGQLCVEVPGNVDTLEGNQILFNDQTGSGPIPAGGGGAPGGTLQQPQWAIQTPTVYPFVNSWGIPSPMSQPWFTGQRPRFYRRAGWIGFVPAPTTGAVITMDCVLVPQTLTADGQQLVVPDNFSDALDNFVCWRALMSDRDPNVKSIADDYHNGFETEVKMLRTWKRDYALEDSQIMLFAERGYYKIGGNITGNFDP